jgi:hypothetical protein
MILSKLTITFETEVIGGQPRVRVVGEGIKHPIAALGLCNAGITEILRNLQEQEMAKNIEGVLAQETGRMPS